MPVFRGQVFQSVTLRLSDPGAFEEAKRLLEGDKRMTVDVHRESDFYVQQSQLPGRILRILAYLITSIMAIGAVFGAVNTMYAAVASRAPEIGVLLTLGFHPRSILASFLVESAIIAAAGGAVGCLFALPINGIVTSTTNWASFSEIAFSFRVTPGLLLAGLVFAVVMGVVGGFFPARRRAPVPVVQGGALLRRPHALRDLAGGGRWPDPPGRGQRGVGGLVRRVRARAAARGRQQTAVRSGQVREPGAPTSSGGDRAGDNRGRRAAAAGLVRQPVRVRDARPSRVQPWALARSQRAVGPAHRGGRRRSAVRRQRGAEAVRPRARSAARAAQGMAGRALARRSRAPQPVRHDG